MPGSYLQHCTKAQLLRSPEQPARRLTLELRHNNSGDCRCSMWRLYSASLRPRPKSIFKRQGATWPPSSLMSLATLSLLFSPFPKLSTSNFRPLRMSDLRCTWETSTGLKVDEANSVILGSLACAAFLGFPLLRPASPVHERLCRNGT